VTLVVILFLSGIFLLALEVVVPGAILGIIGGVLMLVGVGVSFSRFGPSGGAVASGVAVAVGAVALYLEFVLLPKSRLAKALSMTETVAGTSQPPVADRAVVGKRAKAVTPLSPSGLVECEGRRYEAYSRSGHTAAGTTVEIVGMDNFRLIVAIPPVSQPSLT
jgi:membrane-bound serine protease (ClpP class)